MNDKRELISVFTVNWNGKKWLNKFLTSLERQTYKNIEIIVVDNASTDESIRYIEKKFPKVKIVKNKENYGLAKATNIGVRNCSGSYILFINNDTWFDTDFVEKLYNSYTKNDLTVISAEEKRYYDDAEFKCNTTVDITGSPAYYVPTYGRKEKIFYLTVCFFCSKKKYIETRGVDDAFFMYYEDVDWFWRLTLLGKKFGYAENCYIHHAGAGSTGAGLKYTMFLWRNQNALQTLLKNYSIAMLIIVIPLYIIQNLLEIAFFLLLLKPQFAYSYIQGWGFNIKNISKILKKRAWIQQHRKVSDWEVIKKMYWGSGKFLLLKNYLHI